MIDENGGDEGQEEEVEDVEQEARSLGWVPPEEFKGNKNDALTAEDFVERGRHLMPILRQNNRRLQNELLTRDREIGTLKSNLTNAQKAIDRLDAHYTEANKRAVETAKAQLREQMKQAREEGDFDAEESARDKIDELTSSSEQAEKKDSTATAATTTDLDPEFVAWNQENPWYGDTTNPENRKRTKLLIRTAEDLRDEGDTTKGRAFFDRCIKEMEKQLGEPASRTPNQGTKVEGSAGGRSGARAGAGSFATLPREAQEACHADADYLVGKGKKFATLKDWEADYARIYNAQ